MKNFYSYLLLPAIVAAILTTGVLQPKPVAAWQATQEADSKQEADDKEKEEPRDADGLTVADRFEIYAEVRRDEGAEAALDELRGIHEDFPKNIQSGLLLLQVTQQEGMQKSQEERETANELFYESGKIARQLVQLEDFPPAIYNLAGTAIYNEACTLALDGKDEQAMKVLAESFKYGFDDFDHALQDGDFGELLETKAYKKIIEEGRESAKALQAMIAKKTLEQVVKSMDDFESFDFDFDVENTEGESIDKESFEGKLLIVDLWGTWNEPSTQKVPSLIKLKKKFKDKIGIVGLAIERRGDDDEKLEKVSEFMEENDVNYQCALLTDEIREQISTVRFPATIFIDGKGEVRMALGGVPSYEVLEAVAEKIMDKKAMDKKAMDKGAMDKK